MSYLEELLPEFRKGVKIKKSHWSNKTYQYLKDGYIVNQEGGVYNFTAEDVMDNSWELYKDPEPDWNYIIKNKCLCWFWDNDPNWALAGYLDNVDFCRNFSFGRTSLGGEVVRYKHCRPVRRDEVTFYEDKKDE